MQRRKWLTVVLPLVGIFGAGILGYTYLANYGQADTTALVGKVKADDPLPIRQVVLFNSGVGYFQREGEVDGNARVQLSFLVGDINDLLMSLVLTDPKGHIGTVNYESSDPIDKILRSFALDLTGNPTFGQILNQARGEKIDITRAADKKDGQTKLAGTIVGMEVHRKTLGKDQVIETEILNLNTANGLQAIPMDQVISVRFMNPSLESEFQRALHVLASSHDTQKKTVSVGFNGVGKRRVKVGYVVERPIWKTTYRLRMEPNGKVFLQGWALVENTSDDDWNDVRMVLVSGKPISFKMNLYDPIYVPRPLVEPELFASLRPPVYAGSMGDGVFEQRAINMLPGFPGAQMPQMGGYDNRESPLRAGEGKDKKLDDRGKNVYQRKEVERIYKSLEGQQYNQQITDQNRLSFDELQRRNKDRAANVMEAKEKGSVIAGLNFKEGIQSVATASDIGDYYQYVIDQQINLPRQKSAMLPILDQTIDGKKFSIYNEAIQAKYPLLGLKLKNTSGEPLTQGPITIYEGGVFGGDTRILDLQPNEERLLSYALDQGTEVKTEVKQAPSPDLHFRIASDNLTARYYLREAKTYTIKNRSTHDRSVILEQPIRANWKLTDPKKLLEKTRELYRFLVEAPSDKTVSYTVLEDNPRVDNVALHGGQPTYGIANGINIKVETHTDLHKLVGLKIVKGFVLPKHKTRQTKAYYVQNLSDMDRTFTVDYVVPPGWARLDEKGDPEAGPEVYRFKLEIAKGKAGQKSVREERTATDQGVLLKTLPETAIRQYLASSVPSADVKAGLTKALAMQAKIQETQKQIAEVEKQLKTLNEDQARSRENLKIIPPSSDYYKSFLEKFVNQDKQIETHQATSRQLNATLQIQIRDYDQFLAKLDAE